LVPKTTNRLVRARKKSWKYHKRAQYIKEQMVVKEKLWVSGGWGELPSLNSNGQVML